MKSALIKGLGFALFLTTVSVQAASQVGQHYIDRLSSGGPVTVRDVAKSISQTGIDEVEVLDALAERVWRDHKKEGASQVDATSWGIVALGNSGNSRYQSLIKEIADTTPFKKVKKHAQKSLKKLKNGSVEQYKPGTVNLTAATTSKKAAPAPAKKANNGKNVALSEIRVGMSMQEVESLAGPATSSHSHITGKAFNPFNVVGKDAHRMIYYYKGQGRVVFSNQSAYTSTYRVSDVILDADESGYP